MEDRACRHSGELWIGKVKSGKAEGKQEMGVILRRRGRLEAHWLSSQPERSSGLTQGGADFVKQKCDGRHNEVGAPASGIMAGAVLTPWDKDLEPET
jgi:hypothetical protein